MKHLIVFTFIIVCNTFAAQPSTIQQVQTLFKENVHSVNDMLKRGDYDRFGDYENTLEHVRTLLEHLHVHPQIIKDLETYDKRVRKIATAMQTNAPALKDERQQIISDLEAFNQGIASIGLAELLRGWRELGRLKKEFVRKPAKSKKKRFETKWLYVNTLIEELYLDEEYEEPLLSFLERYKSSFDTMAAAYEKGGFENVASLKPLSYKIKSDLLMLTRG